MLSDQDRRLITGFAAAIASLVFIAVNTHPVEIRFVLFSLHLPTVVAGALIAGLGGVAALRLRVVRLRRERARRSPAGQPSQLRPTGEPGRPLWHRLMELLGGDPPIEPGGVGPGVVESGRPRGDDRIVDLRD